MVDVVVVGGGVAGSSAAWHLARRGHGVTLLEQFGPGHDRGSSHGTSRIFRLAYADPFYVDLAVRSLPLWRQLEAETGTSLLTLTGGLDHGPAAITQALHDSLRAAGRPSEQLTPAEATERWPGLRAEPGAVFHPEAGRLHADDCVTALQQAATALGARIRHHTRVRRITTHGRPSVITTADEALSADAVVVAVGGWAPATLRQLGLAAPALRVTQEQPAHFPADDAPSWPIFIHHEGGDLRDRGGVYGTGSPDGVKIGYHGIGPVIDPDHRDRAVDPAVEGRLAAYAAQWLPGVDAAKPESLTCLYTITPDHDFVIDRSGPVTVLGGFSGHGFKFGSLVGALAADLVEGRPGPARFALDRAVPSST
jgi:sarcosine oxidase